ncbi:MAG: ATP-binding protein [Actinomycetia bacterium]|nr:ATP-binding protein [Actinomycetes bacterium]
MERSVYSPGAGHQPPVLAGRDDLIQSWELMTNDVLAAGRVHARDLLLLGPRGIGKTVALTRLGEVAEQAGYLVIDLQAVRGQTTLVASLLDHAETQLEDRHSAWQTVRRHVDSLRLSLTAFGVGAGVDFSARTGSSGGGTAPGRVARMLADLAEAVSTGQPGRGGVMVSIDEIQAATPDDLVLLAAALQRLNVNHPQARVLFAATGLPYTRDSLNRAGVTHPERLFTAVLLPVVLEESEARRAVVEPALARGVLWQPQAVDELLRVTNGYPAHLQLFADAAWRVAENQQITLADVQTATAQVVTALADGTFDPRWASLPNRQREYLAALAAQGGVASAATMSRVLGRRASDLSRARDQAIKAGDVYSPRRGEVRLSVPLFGQYVLSHYEADRLAADDPDGMVSLQQMQQVRAAPELGQ